MPNLTLSLDDATLRAAKVYAAAHGTSISRLVRDHLAEVTGLAPAQNAGRDVLAQFARGELGRTEAMAKLGCDYGTLVQRLAARGLRLPSLPLAELELMAAMMDRLLGEVAQ